MVEISASTRGNILHDISSETCDDKTTRVFLCFVFCSALGLYLDYDLMLMITMILKSQV